jgi:hypothetical protein
MCSKLEHQSDACAKGLAFQLDRSTQQKGQVGERQAELKGTNSMQRSGRRLDNRSVQPTNISRSSWAGRAIDSFARLTGMTADLRAEPEVVLSDLLADLMHWCDFQRIDFESALGRARGNHNKESRA